jgi:excinuclease ABC subunit C
VVLENNADKVKTARIAELLEQAKLLPTKPGCYLMKNKAGSIIYIGKAKNLKNRVQSYFLSGPKGAKTEIMVNHVMNFEFIMTQTEAEALVLENNLIKQHLPKYNIRLKDDKSYPYVVVDKSEPFPRLQYLRRAKRSPQVEVFGPFVVGSRISEVMKILTKSFGLRDCSLYEFRSRKEPCLLYQMRQCSAPCVDKITKEQYFQDLELALMFLRGKGELTLQAILDRMNEASEKEHYELAAHLRDHWSILSAFLNEDQQRLAEFKGGDENFDMIAYYPGEQEIDIALCLVRNGLMLGHKNFHLEGPELEMGFEPSEIVSRFVMAYYSSSFDTLPHQIFLSEKTIYPRRARSFASGCKKPGCYKNQNA